MTIDDEAVAAAKRLRMEKEKIERQAMRGQPGWTDYLAKLSKNSRIRAMRVAVTDRRCLSDGVCLRWQRRIRSKPSRLARKLMAIGRDERITKRAHVTALPPSWGTLYVLTRLDNEQWEKGLGSTKEPSECRRTKIDHPWTPTHPCGGT